MRQETFYLDSSAIVKLIVPEPQTESLEEFLDRDVRRVSSIVAQVEVSRAGLRVRHQAIDGRVQEVLEGMSLLRLNREILGLASRLEPPHLRSLDAIHVATALSLGSELDGLITYDARMSGAARRLGLSILSPA